MLRARQIFGMYCAIILMVGGLVSQLSAQDRVGTQYVISDNGSAPNVSYVPSAAAASQGCSIYGSCASSGCQTASACQTGSACQVDSGCGSANCTNGCSRCCRQGFLQRFREKELEYFQYPPAPSCPGDRLYQLIGAQQANGRIAQLVFYNFHFNFEPRSRNWTLSPAGIQNVYKIARIWTSTPGTVVIESCGDASADQIRLGVVQRSLAQSGIQSDVAIGRPPAIGLTGVEANNTYQQRLLNVPLSPSSAGTSFGGGN